MKRIPLLFCVCLLLSGCAHYTAKDGMKKINQEGEATTVTKYSIIQAIQNGTYTTESPDEKIKELSSENLTLKNDNGQLATQVKQQEQTIANQETAIAQLTTLSVSLQSKLAVFTEQQQQEQKQVELAKKELASLPPLEELSYPKTYRNGKPLTSGVLEKVNVLLLPLGEQEYSQEQIDELVYGISDLNTQIILATGSKENIYTLVRVMNKSAVLTEMGAVISDYEIASPAEGNFVTLKLDKERKLKALVAELPETDVVETFLANGDWKEKVKENQETRNQTMETLLSKSNETDTIILGASLYEPASSDWGTFSPISYRQIDFTWPLTDSILQKGYFDVYRQTHFSEASDAGNTVVMDSVKERVDYIFAKHVLPLSCTVVTLGPLSIEQEGYARYGVLASFLIS
ncbi:MAG: hypothetical protein WCR02_08575 [Sphaerochaetaceae bacterium]